MVEPNKHRVHNLPGAPSDLSLVHYAGHLPVEDQGLGKLFYWLFESPEEDVSKPLVIWLNGGPGCSVHC
jgi:serine carboxypeptidase-like clade 2